jgi:hypothetical protein
MAGRILQHRAIPAGGRIVMVISAAQGLALTRIGFGLLMLAQAMAKTPSWLSDGEPLAQQLQNQLPRSEAF